VEAAGNLRCYTNFAVDLRLVAGRGTAEEDGVRRECGRRKMAVRGIYGA
jgi:hypothetical protein